MKSESPNVRSLVKALVPLVKKCPSMTANDVRSAMYGLQGMHSSSKEGNSELIFFSSDLMMSYDIIFLTVPLLLYYAFHLFRKIILFTTIDDLLQKRVFFGSLPSL